MINRHVWKVTGSILAAVTLAGMLPAVGHTAYEDVKAVAEQGLSGWLSGIPGNEVKGYGFSSQAELAQARLGEPYAIAVIDAKSLDDYVGAEIASISRDIPTRVYVPIEVGGQIRALLEVAQKDGAWKIVAIGRALMAQQMEQARRLLPPGSTWRRSRVIRVFLKNDSYQDLLAVEKEGKTMILPVGSATTALRAALPSTEVLFEPKDILLNLRDINRKSAQSAH